MKGRVSERGYASKKLKVLSHPRDIPVRGGGSAYSTLYRVSARDEKEDRLNPVYHDYDVNSFLLSVPAPDQAPKVWSEPIILEPWINFGRPSSFQCSRIVCSGYVTVPHFKYLHQASQHLWSDVITTGDEFQGLWSPYALRPSFVALVLYPGVHVFNYTRRTCIDIPRPFQVTEQSLSTIALPFLQEEARKMGCRVLAFDRLDCPQWQAVGTYSRTRVTRPVITIPGDPTVEFEPEMTETKVVQLWAVPSVNLPFLFDVSFQEGHLQPKSHYLGLKKEVLPGVAEDDPERNDLLYSMTDSVHLYAVTYEPTLGYNDSGGTDVSVGFYVGCKTKFTVQK